MFINTKDNVDNLTIYYINIEFELEFIKTIYYIIYRNF